jgi:thiol-disulfide isomerase/thioredoxin
MRIIKIGAVWCSGCLVMRPRWQQIEEENPFLDIEYFDFDTNPEVAKKYNIESGVLPCFIFLDAAGTELTRLSGEVSKEEILKTIEENKDK